MEYTYNYSNKLYAYRTHNDLKIKETAKIAGVSPDTWSCWEKSMYGINKDNYLKLKDLKIL